MAEDQASVERITIKSTNDIRQLIELTRKAARVPEDLAKRIAITTSNLLSDVERLGEALDQRTQEVIDLGKANSELALKMIDMMNDGTQKTDPESS